jgi:hypothetical protein
LLTPLTMPGHPADNWRAPFRTWISEWNSDPKLFVWTKAADEIQGTLAAYCRRINDSTHQ